MKTPCDEVRCQIIALGRDFQGAGIFRAGIIQDPQEVILAFSEFESQ